MHTGALFHSWCARSQPVKLGEYFSGAACIGMWITHAKLTASMNKSLIYMKPLQHYVDQGFNFDSVWISRHPLWQLMNW